MSGLLAGDSMPRRVSSRTPSSARSGSSGFSLTEVAVAIAIIAFAFVSLTALIPTSLQTFRKAMDTTVTAQIAQRVIGEAQETDFDYLVDSSRNNHEAQNKEFQRLPRRYFDDQGNELGETQKTAAQYWVVVRVTQPGDPNPATHQSSWFASLPEARQPFNPREMTIVTVQLVTNPGQRALPFEPSTMLLDSFAAAQACLNYQSYSAVISRNGYTPKTP
jgi:uncharacterized protein (TIGR02598 family)